MLPAHGFQPLQAAATPPRCAYVSRRRNQCIVWAYFSKNSVTVNSVHKCSMGFVKGSLVLHMGRSRGAVHDTGHDVMIKPVAFVPLSLAQDSGDDSDIYQ